MSIIYPLIIIIITIILVQYARMEDYISWIYKNHLKKIPIIIKKNYICHKSKLTWKEKNEIFSFSKEDLEYWDNLITRAKAVANKYTFLFDEYISEEFPHIRGKKGTESFFAKHNRNLDIECMTIQELKLLLAETEENWENRRRDGEIATKIKLENPNGYEKYRVEKNIQTLSSVEIVRNKYRIEEYQKFYETFNMYKEWEKKQTAFCNEFYNLCKKYRERDGRFNYSVEYSHSTDKGTSIMSKFKIWQGFTKSFNKPQKESQPEIFEKSRKELLAFQNKERFFLDAVYNGIYEIINALSSENGYKVFVTFVYSSQYNWGKETYDYHYRKMKAILATNNIKYCDFESIPVEGDNIKCDVIFVVDLITHNDDLKNNCRLLSEFFCKKTPNICYYSLIKEYSEDDTLRLK